jgi:hypothetical protein
MPNKTLERLKDSHHVIEAYVLLREMKVHLNVGHEGVSPKAEIRIWLGTNTLYPYSFELSHFAHTPLQEGPYMPSRVDFPSEEEAIDSAINALTAFLISAIKQDLEPADSWLVPNEDF